MLHKDFEIKLLINLNRLYDLVSKYWTYSNENDNSKHFNQLVRAPVRVKKERGNVFFPVRLNFR